MTIFVLSTRAMRNMIVTAILIFVHTFAYLLPKHLTAAIRQDERFSVRLI